MAEMLKKVVLHSVATAFARRVLPASGGATVSEGEKLFGGTVMQERSDTAISSCSGLFFSQMEA